MNTPHKHADAIKAWADGTVVEVKYTGHTNWGYLPRVPEWFSSAEYRIQPEPKYTVLAYKIVTDKDGLEETQRTTIIDPAATQWSLIRTDGVGYTMFTFSTYPDAYAACQAVNKSTTFAQR